MILTEQEIHPALALPGVEDRAMAARVTTFVCLMASGWFFITPLTFFGVSHEASGLNCWLVGGLMVALCLLRILAPRETWFFTWVLTVLGLWVMISPWVFGYADNLVRVLNSVGVGACVFAFSTASRNLSRQLLYPRSLASDNSE